MAIPTLEIRDLRIEFPTRRRTLVALDGVSLSIAPGEILGLVGESGAGKSLTGAAVIGLLQPPGRIASGQILLQGERIDNLPPAKLRATRGRRIGAIFQDPLTSLNPLLTIGDAAGRDDPHPSAAEPPRCRSHVRSTCCARSASRPRRPGSTSIRTSSPAACGSGW